MTAEEKYDLIERYCNGELSAEEEKQVMALQQQDSDFKQELELYQSTLQVVDDLVEDDLKDYLSRVEKDLSSTNSKTNAIPLQIWFAVAASVVIIIVFSYLFWPTNSSPEALYEAYFEPYRNVVYPVSRSGELPTLIDSAFNYYEKRMYNEAILAFERIPSAYPTTDLELDLYLGISYLANNDATRAKEILLKAQLKSSEFTSEYQWYLALANLKLNNIPQAKQHLKSLQQQGGATWKKQATTLLNQLNE